ncbi:MAG: helix-turn-helix domain-containing protein [Angustibacter sp.]
MSRLDDLFAPYPEHLTVEQLAELLGVTRLTAYRWLTRGVVPGYKVGRAWLILRDEVRDHLAQNTNQPFGPAIGDDSEDDASPK